jgi:hypothetical protein
MPPLNPDLAARSILPAMIAVKPTPRSTQNCARDLPGGIFGTASAARRLFCYPVVISHRNGRPAGAAVRRMHGRHAAILLDFCRDQFMFSPSTRVLPAVWRLVVADRANCRVLMMSDESHKKPESDKIYVRKQRKCLRCQEAFTSAWPGERVCTPCKSSSEWRDGIAA